MNFNLKKKKNMRCFFSLIILFLMTSFSSLYAQKLDAIKITFPDKDLSLIKVFELIEKQTDYSIIYSDEVGATTATISFKQTTISLSDVLEKLKNKFNISYSVSNNTISVKKSKNSNNVSQNKKYSIKGKVITDDTNESLPGVTVAIKGEPSGTITDSNGKFTLENIPSGSVVVFSFIGMDPKEMMISNNAADLTVKLKNMSVSLNEVVAVGYGKMTRKDVTSSITTISAKEMNVGVYSEPSQLLQGKVPGLTITQTSDPNGSSSITLRGASTLRTGEAQEPYYVIDGIPGLSISLIAPEDIESIDVLRDASATSIYGSKAANGVILVTTKKGNNNGETNVNYSTYIAFDNILKNLDMMSASELRSYASDNGITLSDDEGYDTDWQKEVQRTGVSQSHNVSINGGSENTSYSASINYMEQQGIIKETNKKRIVARTFLETSTLKDHLTLSFGLNGSIINSNTVPMDEEGMSVLDAMNYYSPLVPVKDEDGEWYSNISAISQYYNPMSMVKEDEYDTETKQLQGTAKAALKIIDGLVYNVNLSYQNEQYLYNTYHSTASQIEASKNGEATRTAVENKKTVFETYLNYDKTFNDVHKLGLLAGYSWEESQDSSGFGLTVYNFYNDEVGYDNLYYANSMDMSGINDDYTLSTLRMISFYGRVNYGFKSKYLLQATVRRDGSSAFGANNRWATFPSVSASWRLTEEDFIKNMNLFDDLKFRVGYGVSGNSLGFDAYTAIQTYGATEESGWFTYTDESGSSSDYRVLTALGNANPDLKWETTSMFNIGLDFGFFKNRLTGTLEYYDKQTDDLIYNYSVSTNRYPYSEMTANVGKIGNKGVELSLSIIPVQTQKFRWETTLNLSHNDNKVIKLSNDTYSVDYIDAGEPRVAGYTGATIQRIMEGEPIGTFYTWEWAGYDDSGMSQFYVHDEETGERTGELTTSPEDKDRTKVGCAQPKLTYGWNNTLTYKKLSLTAFFQGVSGGDIFNTTRAQYNNISLVASGKNVLSEVATNQNYGDDNAQAPSDRYLEKGGYLRLSTLSLNYNFGKIKDLIKGLNIYATCNNVLTVSDYKGLDPEITLGGLTPGIDDRASFYPRTRTFMLGLNINL